MAYNFDQQLPRIGTYSCKWDQYGDPDIIAMSTADMDFRTADTIIDALTAVAQEGCFNYHMEPGSLIAMIASVESLTDMLCTALNVTAAASWN